MTSPEERLRELLCAAAEEVVPSSDALPRIRARVAERRSLRRWQPALGVLAACAVVVAGAATTSVTSGSRPAPRAVEDTRPEPPAPEPSGCVDGGEVLCAEPEPPPAVPATSGVTTSAESVPLWPFVDDRGAAAWARSPGTRAWADDPRAVVQHLLDDHLGLAGWSAGTARDAGDPGAAEVPVTRSGRAAGTARLVRVGTGARLPWSVTGVRSDEVALTGPREGQGIGSPAEARGTATGPVRVRLLATSGDELAAATAALDGSGRWSASLPWTSMTWSTGAVVAVGASPPALALEPVRRTGSPGPGLPPAASTFVAVDRGAVVLHDARTGQRLRQLSYPPAGTVDGAPARGGDAVVFVRERTDGCASAIVWVRLDSGAGVTVPERDVRRERLAVSPDGRELAWVERPCSGDPSAELVRRGPDGVAERVPLRSASGDLGSVAHLGLRDDGTLVVESAAGGLLVLPPGATTFDAARRVTPPGRCADTAPAWSGADLVLWRGCAGRRVALRLAGPTFGSGLQSPSDPLPSVLRTGVVQTDRGPEVLVQAGTRDDPGPVLRLVDGRLVELYGNAGCGTGSCLVDASW